MKIARVCLKQSPRLHFSKELDFVVQTDISVKLQTLIYGFSICLNKREKYCSNQLLTVNCIFAKNSVMIISINFCSAGKFNVF